MTNSQTIYKDLLPDMAQWLIDGAKQCEDRYDLSITLNEGIIFEVYNKETGNLVARYFMQDNGTDNEGRVLRFFHNGYEYMVNSSSKLCYFAVSKDWEPVIEQSLYQHNYRCDINYDFEIFKQIFSIFMNTTFKQH